jgi:hypothetical protein
MGKKETSLNEAKEKIKELKKNLERLQKVIETNRKKGNSIWQKIISIEKNFCAKELGVLELDEACGSCKNCDHIHGDSFWDTEDEYRCVLEKEKFVFENSYKFFKEGVR